MAEPTTPKPAPRSRLSRILRHIEMTIRRRLRDPVLIRLRGYRRRAMPIAMITGSEGKTTTTRLLASILEKAGHTVGLATTDGVIVAGETAIEGDYAGKPGHRVALADPRVTAAALETARGGLKRMGLYIRPVTAAALLNVGMDHLGTDGIDTLDAMARLKGRVTDAARHVVLNADDPRCLAFARRYRPARLTLFSLDPRHPALASHLAAGGRAVVAGDDGMALLLEKGKPPVRLVDLAAVPVTLGGRAAIFVSDALAAAALGLALGAGKEAVGEGLRAFRTGMDSNPGRLTFLEGYPCTVVVDRAMAPDSFATAVETMTPLVAVPGRRVALVLAVGNRSDGQYRELGHAVATRCDHAIVYEEEAYRRGRAVGEAAELLRRRIEEGARAAGAQGDTSGASAETASSFEDALSRAAPHLLSGGVLHIISGRLDIAEHLDRAFAAAKPPSPDAEHGNSG